MICSTLLRIGVGAEGLCIGNYMDEFNVRPGCQFSSAGLNQLREGKEGFIDEQLTGFCNLLMPTDGYACGFESERMDFHTLMIWQQDLGQCLHDRKRGATS